MKSDWVKCSKAVLCPVCKHRGGGWCMVSRDGKAAICPRTPKGWDKDLGNGNYLFRLGDSFVAPPPVEHRPEPVEYADVDWLGVVATHVQRVESQEQTVRIDLERMGLSFQSMERLSLGLDRGKIAKGPYAMTWPMRAADGLPIGIRYRSLTGGKWTYDGSRSGLFFDPALPLEEPIVITEGPTDTAAAMDMGFAAIGRPSCGYGSHCTACNGKPWCPHLIMPLVKGRACVLVADNDEPGSHAAVATEKFAACIGPICSTLKVIHSPREKDLRRWRQHGATRRHVMTQIADVTYWRSKDGKRDTVAVRRLQDAR